MRNRLVYLLLAASALLSAQQIETLHRTVRASGEATVTAKPDRAEISIGVVTMAPAADDSSKQNAKASAQLLQSLKRLVGQSGEIKTTSYSIAPEYQYSQNGVPPKLTGYRTTNTVMVTVDDITLVGKLLDTATQSGANNISGISFSLKDDAPVRTRALAEAAVQARANAESIAKALNLHVTGVVHAESSSEVPPIRPLMMPLARASSSAPSTPVETGTLDIHATVIVTLGVE